MEQNPLEEIRTEKSHIWLNMQPKRFKERIQFHTRKWQGALEYIQYKNFLKLNVKKNSERTAWNNVFFTREQPYKMETIFHQGRRG